MGEALGVPPSAEALSNNTGVRLFLKSRALSSQASTWITLFSASELGDGASGAICCVVHWGASKAEGYYFGSTYDSTNKNYDFLNFERSTTGWAPNRTARFRMSNGSIQALLGYNISATVTYMAIVGYD